MAKNTPSSNNDLFGWPLHLLEIVSLKEAARISSASEDTIRRDHADKIVRLSERRVGIHRGHALMIGNTAKK